MGLRGVSSLVLSQGAGEGKGEIQRQRLVLLGNIPPHPFMPGLSHTPLTPWAGLVPEKTRRKPL